MATQVIAIEGDGTAGVEQGLVPAEATTDISDLSLDFEVETPGVWLDEPRIARLVVVEAQTEGQALTVTVVHDGTATALTTTVSTSAGTKARVEIPIALTGTIWSVRLAGTALTSRIEVSAIELVLNDPDGAGG